MSPLFPLDVWRAVEIFVCDDHSDAWGAVRLVVSAAVATPAALSVVGITAWVHLGRCDLAVLKAWVLVLDRWSYAWSISGVRDEEEEKKGKFGVQFLGHI